MVKPMLVVTSIKQSPALSSHPFKFPSEQMLHKLNCPVLNSSLLEMVSFAPSHRWLLTIGLTVFYTTYLSLHFSDKRIVLLCKMSVQILLLMSWWRLLCRNDETYCEIINVHWVFNFAYFEVALKHEFKWSTNN